MDFLIDNILLIAIIVVCAVSLGWPAIQKRRYPGLDNTSATRFINRQNAQVIDLREPKEFRKECIAGSVNIPADVIHHELERVSKERPVLLVDEDGRKSRMASMLLRGMGYKDVYVLQGGLVSWRKELPFTR